MAEQARRVVVTGGAQGIGLATALAFLRTGAWVFVLDEDREALAELPGSIVGIRTDLRNPDDIERACSHIAGQAVGVDVLVNNAGINGPSGSILDVSIADWDRVLEVNLRSHWLMAKTLVPVMPPGSAIVNIASTRALQSEPDTELYAASKGGVVALTHALAISLADRRIRVNAISPGWIDVSRAKKASARNPEVIRPVDHLQHPAQRVGAPEDVAAAVLYLASNMAGFITGTNLVVDGGMTRKMIYAP